VSDSIQQAAMDTRMAPIGTLFSRFKRVIRDLTHANGKNIALVITGETTELDKRMIDELGDPLINLVRNAVEHGIESPQQRQAMGKPAQGTIALEAFRRGNNVVIQISDDGQGIDADRLREKAIQRNIVSAAAAESMSHHDILQLIWEKGLSTADATSAERGMGMEVVRSKIADLSGTIESEPGRGTTLSIRLPLTLAILPSLMVEIEGDVFAVPLESVAEVVRLRPDDMKTVHGQPTARVRDDVVSMIFIHNLLTWGNSKEGLGDNEAMLVVLDEKGQRLGLVVNDILGEEDIVIKSIADNYRNIFGVVGASIRGDGRVSLILDPPAIFKMIFHGNAPSGNV
jgi:two-component system chemotaxis sensor kinase CheA